MNQNKTKKSKGKGTIGMLLMIPVSFVAILVIIYVALYGSEFPFEIRLKTGTAARYENWAKSVADSIDVLKDAISRAKTESQEYSNKLKELQKEVRNFARERQVLSAEVTKLQTQSDELKSQIDATRLARIQKLNKAMKAMPDKEISSLLVQLDNRTLIELLQNARDKQVATILGALKPNRAAKLTRQYLYTK